MKCWLRSVLLLCVFQSALAGGYLLDGQKPTVIIDVRSAEEFAAGHIDGAINIPYEQIGQGVPALSLVNRDSTIVLYCRSGRRSAIAASTLQKLGYGHVIDGGAQDQLTSRLQPCNGSTC